MPSLWGVVHELATGAAWPPADDEGASLFLHRVNQESLLPLFFDDPPAAEAVRRVSAGFRALERAHVARSRMIMAALDKLAGHLDGTPFIVLKGCDYAYRFYPRPELRPMADVDVLVPEGEMGGVIARLRGLGLEQSFPSGGASRAASHHVAVFTIDNVTIEIHSRFIQRSRYRIDYAEVWKRAEPFAARSFRALRLSAADALAYLTMGICLEYFIGPLIRYVDLWRLVEDSGDQVLLEAADLAGQWQTRHAFYGALRYGARLFPELASDRFESAMSRSLGPRRRAFMDRYVIPHRVSSPKALPSRPVQLWRKFWTMDSMYRRSCLVAEQTAAAVRGRLA